jgi:hypothetical protein
VARVAGARKCFTGIAAAADQAQIFERQFAKIFDDYLSVEQIHFSAPVMLGYVCSSTESPTRELFDDHGKSFCAESHRLQKLRLLHLIVIDVTVSARAPGY